MKSILNGLIWMNMELFYFVLICSTVLNSALSSFLTVFEGPGGLTQLRETCRIHFHHSWYLADFMGPSYGQQSKQMIFDLTFTQDIDRKLPNMTSQIFQNLLEICYKHPGISQGGCNSCLTGLGRFLKSCSGSCRSIS